MDIKAVQQAYIMALKDEKDVSMFIQMLIDADCQLSLRYMILNMESLIELNSQNVDQLHRITIALSILEKYTRHLLKPEEIRSNMWKYVKFSNQIFKDRVDAIQGGRDLMKVMGYTKDIKDGLSFPDDGKTDPDQLISMLADILLGKQEVNLYLTGSHPHSRHIDRLLPQNTIIELRRFQTKLQQINPISIIEASINQPSTKQDTCNTETQPTAVQQNPQLSPNYSSPQSSYRPSTEQSHLSPASRQAYNYSTAMMQDITNQQTGVPLQNVGNNQQLHSAQPSLGPIDSSQIPLVAKLLAQGKSISIDDIENRSNSAFTAASRQGTTSESPVASTETIVQSAPPPVPQYNSANDSMVQTSAEESVFPSGSACDICGNRQAEIICEICDHKQLCKGCDNKWHQHPRRQNHKRQNMAGFSIDPTPSQQRSRSASLGESSAATATMFDQKHVRNTSEGGGNDVYVTANFNPSYQGHVEKQPGIGYITQKIQNLETENYDRRRTSSSGEGEMSPMVEPHSVQTGNWSGHHHNQYGYSHQTGRPVQTFVSGSPMSHVSSSPTMAGGNPYFGNQYLVGQQLPRNQQFQGNPSLQMIPQLQNQQQSLSSSAPGGPPTSRLLPGIMTIPDLHRRKSKLEINLMTLREEIEEVESKINDLISQNAHFFSDPEYSALFKRKGLLTREKMELEKYEKDLDQSLREDEQSSLTTRKGSLPDVLSQPVIYPPPYVPVSGTPSHISNQQLVSPSPGYVFYQYIPTTMTSGGSLSPETGLAYSLIPATPQVIAQHHNMHYPQTYGSPGGSPHFQGMFQHPSQPQPQIIKQQQNVSTLPRRVDNRGNLHQFSQNQKSSDGKIQNVSPTVNVKPQNKAHEVMQTEVNQDQQNVLKQSPPIPHRRSMGDKPHSYVNVPKSPPAFVENEKQTAAVAKSEGRRSWICSHCTFHNSSVKEGSPKVCAMCSKTSNNPQYVDDPATVDDAVDKIIDQSEANIEEETAVLEVGRHIGEVYDQIHLEKMAAQKQYKEKLEKEKLQQAALKVGLPKPKLPDPVVSNTVIVKAKPETQQQPDSSQKLINRPKESPGGTSDTPPFSGGKISGSLGTKNFAETLEDIQRKKQQEEMAFEGKKLLMLLKNCEKDGMEPDELEIAVDLCGDTPVDKWLKEKWMPRVDKVIHMATNQGAQMEKNDVGEISVAESKEALKINNCDEVKAAKYCIENRRKLYKEIKKHGHFAREEILQAMLHSQGDLESAVDEMNSKWLQLFHDRLWPTDDFIQQPVEEDPFVEDQQRAQDAAIARATSEICNSITNSVLSHTSFQALIKDRNIDLERRIRLILVEGKLQSWGRAEIVIRIIDEEVAKDKLDASLEEVVEAVRNCGDRSSSLVFLKQYCECCYSQFPMTKIRNLGCSCKICVQCVRQNFEVAIREKHVRNMNCPLCSQPNMEDMEAASDYLTFLSMLLQTMISQDIMELYHSKLRDWHLQKDPNFRWCVHCGNGFIWTVGNQTLKMVCPTCQGGTCFNCKKMWEDQHEGLTCEQFTQWKMDNDPENQTLGLARYLENNGIDCPSCKMKYSLAKGGCMHFKCPQCGFEFCSGCSQPFYQKGVCRRYNSCRNKGFHCHHPRNCLYYLRDENFDDLQKLLKNNKIQFNTTAPDQESGQTCPVMEQKEDPEGKRDEACGREVQEGFAGLCMIHYKEYLVSLINKRNLDPVAIMSVEAMKRLIEREEKKVPERKGNEAEAKYRKRLEQFIREIEPLIRQE